MSDNINFFFRNRKETDGKLYFKSWLPAVYFSPAELLRRSSVESAVKRYNKELNAAISICKKKKNSFKFVKKLEGISRYFLKMTQETKQEIFHKAYYVEKSKREKTKKRKIKQSFETILPK